MGSQESAQMASDVARFMMKQYLDSWDLMPGNSWDLVPSKFNGIAAKLKAHTGALTKPESIRSLSVLNDALTEWKILKEQKKKRIFSFQMNEESAINAKIEDLEKSLERLLETSSSSTQPNFLRLGLDAYTFYKPNRITGIEGEVPDEGEKRMVDWLLTAAGNDFKAVGIWGMGGSGKTALVRNVLKQKAVGDKFKRIIWGCLSELTCEEEIDDWIIKYLLYRLGLDADSLVCDTDEKEWLMEEVERRLVEPRNYILVLDDMWHCSKWFADDFLGRLKKIDGGVVIVTSRRRTVAEKIGEKNKLIHLHPMAYKESAFSKIETKN